MRTASNLVVRLRAGLLAAGLALAGLAAFAADAPQAIEQALAAAQHDKRGITLYVGGQAIGGAVLRLEPGAWVELRNQLHGRIVVRLDRIDAVGMP
jgi:hypothetical protein